MNHLKVYEDINYGNFLDGVKVAIKNYFEFFGYNTSLEENEIYIYSTINELLCSINFTFFKFHPIIIFEIFADDYKINEIIFYEYIKILYDFLSIKDYVSIKATSFSGDYVVDFGASNWKSRLGKITLEMDSIKEFKSDLMKFINSDELRLIIDSGKFGL